MERQGGAPFCCPGDGECRLGSDRLDLDRLRDGLEGLRGLESPDSDAAGVRQARVAGDEAVDLGSARTALVDAPWYRCSQYETLDQYAGACKRLTDDERLSATAVTGSKDAVNAGRVLAGRRLEVRATVLLETKRCDRRVFRTEEAEREENEVRGEELLRARNLAHAPSAHGVLLPLHADGVDTLELAVLVALERLGRDRVLARVLAKVGGDLLRTRTRGFVSS